MRFTAPILWMVASVVAPGVGCHCEGAPKPLPVPKFEVKQGTATPAPDKKVATPAEPGRFNRERTGFVTAKLGDRTVEFTVLPAKKNRVSLRGKPSLVVVDAFATQTSTEHLRVHMQGWVFEDMRGRTVMPRKDAPSGAVAVTYTDAEGKTWVGKAGPTGPVIFTFGEIETGTQAVTGTFSGQLKQTGGDAVLEVVDGSFKTELARPD